MGHIDRLVRKIHDEGEGVALDAEIENSKSLLWSWVGVCIFVFVLWILFALRREQPGDALSVAGVVGDFFGGMLNPVIALATLYWLTRGVRMQRQELSETRVALQDQGRQAAMGTRIAALTALIDAKNSDIERLRAQLQQITDQLLMNPMANGAFSASGTYLTKAGGLLQDHQTQLDMLMHQAADERKPLVEELKKVLSQSRKESS